MKLPFLKCLSCSQNEGNTRIKISSSCLSKPMTININNEDNEEILLVEQILNILIANKKNNVVDLDETPRE